MSDGSVRSVCQWHMFSANMLTSYIIYFLTEPIHYLTFDHSWRPNVIDGHVKNVIIQLKSQASGSFTGSWTAWGPCSRNIYGKSLRVLLKTTQYEQNTVSAALPWRHPLTSGQSPGLWGREEPFWPDKVDIRLMQGEAAAHWKHAAKKEQAQQQRAETRITDPDRRDSGAPIKCPPRRKSEKSKLFYIHYS